VSWVAGSQFLCRSSRHPRGPEDLFSGNDASQWSYDPCLLATSHASIFPRSCRRSFSRFPPTTPTLFPNLTTHPAPCLKPTQSRCRSCTSSWPVSHNGGTTAHLRYATDDSCSCGVCAVHQTSNAPHDHMLPAPCRDIQHQLSFRGPEQELTMSRCRGRCVRSQLLTRERTS
jgi:hypothetical protein